MTDRVHFDDLKKIDVVLGHLDDDTYNRLRAHDGPIELRAHQMAVWQVHPEPNWNPSMRYRAAPFTKPDVPWEHMAAWIQYAARDEDGRSYGYEEEPEPEGQVWLSNGREAPLYAFKIDPGTCDWRDSLVKRPEGL